MAALRCRTVVPRADGPARMRWRPRGAGTRSADGRPDRMKRRRFGMEPRTRSRVPAVGRCRRGQHEARRDGLRRLHADAVATARLAAIGRRGRTVIGTVRDRDRGIGRRCRGMAVAVAGHRWRGSRSSGGQRPGADGVHARGRMRRPDAVEHEREAEQDPQQERPDGHERTLPRGRRGRHEPGHSGRAPDRPPVPSRRRSPAAAVKRAPGPTKRCRHDPARR